MALAVSAFRNNAHCGLLVVTFCSDAELCASVRIPKNTPKKMLADTGDCE
jgi:hypothetical protein